MRNPIKPDLKKQIITNAINLELLAKIPQEIIKQKDKLLEVIQKEYFSQIDQEDGDQEETELVFEKRIKIHFQNNSLELDMGENKFTVTGSLYDYLPAIKCGKTETNGKGEKELLGGRKFCQGQIKVAKGSFKFDEKTSEPIIKIDSLNLELDDGRIVYVTK